MQILFIKNSNNNNDACLDKTIIWNGGKVTVLSKVTFHPNVKKTKRQVKHQVLMPIHEAVLRHSNSHDPSLWEERLETHCSGAYTRCEAACSRTHNQQQTMTMNWATGKYIYRYIFYKNISTD